MIRIIHLGGDLQSLSKEPIKLSCDNVKQLIVALESQVKGFRAAQIKHKEFMVVLSDEEGNVKQITPDNIDMNFSKKKNHIFIAPNVQGSGAEIAAWVVAAVGATGTAATIVTALVQIGISLVLSAVVSMLAPKPKTGGAAAEQEASFIYNGAVNVEGQGGPVPLIFGVHMAGSTVISSETFVEQMKKEVAKNPEPGAAEGNPTPPAPPYDPFYSPGDGGA